MGQWEDYIYFWSLWKELPCHVCEYFPESVTHGITNKTWQSWSWSWSWIAGNRGGRYIEIPSHLTMLKDTIPEVYWDFLDVFNGQKVATNLHLPRWQMENNVHDAVWTLSDASHDIWMHKHTPLFPMIHGHGLCTTPIQEPGKLPWWCIESPQVWRRVC